MIKGGYILQPRLFDQSDAARMPPCARELWLYLLRNVNHKDNGKFKRGQGFFNIGDMRNALCWYSGYRKMTYSKTQFTAALRRLRGDVLLTSLETPRGLVITICNYDLYQSPLNYGDTNGGTADDTRRHSDASTINKKDKKKEVKEKRFMIPALEEVKKYCLQRKNNIDPQKFISFYDSKGWMIGKNKMKNWKAAIVTWEKNDSQNGSSSTQGDYI